MPVALRKTRNDERRAELVGVCISTESMTCIRAMIGKSGYWSDELGTGCMKAFHTQSYWLGSFRNQLLWRLLGLVEPLLSQETSRGLSICRARPRQDRKSSRWL
jgi:hypothetical protein